MDRLKRDMSNKDNKNLQMWIIYPPGLLTQCNFLKQNPRIALCQGVLRSPWTELVVQDGTTRMMAGKGYIVIAPNRRGVQGFGQAWKEQLR